MDCKSLIRDKFSNNSLHFDSTAVFFYLFAAIAILSAARVVSHPKPVYSAVYFGVVVLCVAALLLVQEAEFLAVALVIIYAGAILVTYAFVIMLAQQAGAPRYDTRAREPFAAVVLGFVAMATVAAAAGRSAHSDKSGAGERPRALASENALPDKDTPAADEVPAVTTGEDDRGNTIAMGRSLLGSYVIALEVAGVLLLVAMVGAIALVKKKIPREEPSEPVRPLGEIGKQVEPF